MSSCCQRGKREGLAAEWEFQCRRDGNRRESIFVVRNFTQRERERKKDERGVGHGYLLGLKDKAGGASS